MIYDGLLGTTGTNDSLGEILRPSRSMSTHTRATLQEQILTPEDVSTLLGVAVATLADWRSQGGYGPDYVKAGRKVIYLLRDLESWMESQKQHGTTNQERTVAVQIPRQRTNGTGEHRFGGYRTKQDQSRASGNPTPAGDSRRPVGDRIPDTASV